jgi:hypothetical protein
VRPLGGYQLILTCREGLIGEACPITNKKSGYADAFGVQEYIIINFDHMSIIVWKTINWTQVEFRVRRYQTRIYKASRDTNTIRLDLTKATPAQFRCKADGCTTSYNIV